MGRAKTKGVPCYSGPWDVWGDFILWNYCADIDDGDGGECEEFDAILSGAGFDEFDDGIRAFSVREFGRGIFGEF
jgi:hypothetical protein